MRTLLAVVPFFLALAFGAHAHMPSGYDLRAIHFLQSAEGLHAYYRLTFPLVVAKGMGSKRPDGFQDPPPFTVLRIESAHAFYYLDVQRIRQAPLELAKLVTDGHRLVARGQVLQPTIQSVRVYPKGYVPPFNTLQQIRRAAEPGEAYPIGAPEVDAAYALVDVHVIYPNAGEEFRLSSSLNNQVIGQLEIQNLIVDHRPSGNVLYRSSGLMTQAVTINPSRRSAIRGFIAHGAEHVLSGTDHLLFVLCLTLGAVGFSALVWRVTGFTLGHTISLMLGFWGYVPDAKWFVPTVETAIAASILIAAASLLLEGVKQRGLIVLVVLVGFIHGLGFSFGLRQMLDVKGPHVWTSLGAFNVGVELGQILFALAVFLVFRVIVSRWHHARVALLRTTSLACMLVSTIWIVERARPILAA